MGVGFPGIVASTGKPILTANASQDRRLSPEHDAVDGEPPEHVLCLPVIGPDGHEVFGKRNCVRWLRAPDPGNSLSLPSCSPLQGCCAPITSWKRKAAQIHIN